MKKTKQHKLLVEQLDKKLQSLKSLKEIAIPGRGWIHAIRTALKMSLRQMGNKLSITPQSMKEIEQREKDDSITLKSLREAGKVLNMKLAVSYTHLTLPTILRV